MDEHKWGVFEKGGEMDFYTASALGLLDRVQYLIRCRGKNIDETNSEEWTGLMYACYYERELIVEFFVKEGADKTVLNKDMRSCTTLAAIAGNPNILNHVFCANMIDRKDRFDCTPLFYAAEHCHYACVEYLLEKGGNPNLLSNNKTPLMLCSEKGLLDMVKILLKHGADVNLTNSERITAIQLADEKNHAQIVTVLKIHGSSSIENILKQAGLEKYWKYFEQNQVNFSQFLAMTEEDMKNIGISLFGPRRKLTLIIADLKRNFK
ncbi:ankyrin repeat domain-containing protein 16-like isoform X2 [Rhodnius prolixus]